MKKIKSLIQIVEQNKLSIKDNPYGIERSWPKSYIKSFYCSFCSKLYQYEKSPNILEINQLNDLNIKLWELFFESPNIDNFSFEKIIGENYKKSSRYDLIIVNYKNKKFNIKILKILINLLKSNGIIIIENIGRNTKNLIEIFYYLLNKYNLQIKDYRLKRFILNNCLLIISKKDTDFFHKINNLLILILFILSEIFLSFFISIIEKIK